MKVSTKAETLKQQLLNLNDEQINGLLMNVSEGIGSMNLDHLIDDLFWSRKWYAMSFKELFEESNRLAEWFGSNLYFTRNKFNEAVDSYFKNECQPADSILNPQI